MRPSIRRNIGSPQARNLAPGIVSCTARVVLPGAEGYHGYQRCSRIHVRIHSAFCKAHIVQGTCNRGVWVKKLKFVVSLTTRDNDYQMEQASAADEAAQRFGAELQIL